MKVKFLLPIFLLIIDVGSVFAQQDTTGALTLKECVNIALEKNLKVKRGLYNVESYEINLLQAKMAFLPTVNAGAAYGENYGRNLNPVTNSFVTKNSATTNAQLTGSWTLFNGLRIQNLLRQNFRDRESANQDLAKAKNDVIINVVTLYTNVIFNRELLDNANSQLASSQDQLDRIKKQVAAGSLSRSSELNQEAQVATNEVSLINQENALNLSILQLKQAMQVPASNKIDVIKPEIDIEDLILDQTAEQIYQTALQTMPEVKSAILKKESADFTLSANKGNLYPRLSFNASAQSNSSSLNKKFISDGGFALSSNPVAKVNDLNGANVYGLSPTGNYSDYGHVNQLKDNLYKVFSLQINIPVFNGLQNRTAVQRSAVNSELALISLQETENTLRQSIETAYNDALSAAKTYSSSLKQVSAREEAYRMNKQRFDLGGLSYVEYHISENDLFQAKNDLTRAKYNFIFKKKILDFYQGKAIDY